MTCSYNTCACGSLILIIFLTKDQLRRCGLQPLLIAVVVVVRLGYTQKRHPDFNGLAINYLTWCMQSGIHSLPWLLRSRWWWWWSRLPWFKVPSMIYLDAYVSAPQGPPLACCPIYVCHVHALFIHWLPQWMHSTRCEWRYFCTTQGLVTRRVRLCARQHSVSNICSLEKDCCNSEGLRSLTWFVLKTSRVQGRHIFHHSHKSCSHVDSCWHMFYVLLRYTSVKIISLIYSSVYPRCIYSTGYSCIARSLFITISLPCWESGQDKLPRDGSLMCTVEAFYVM